MRALKSDCERLQAICQRFEQTERKMRVSAGKRNRSGEGRSKANNDIRRAYGK